MISQINKKKILIVSPQPWGDTYVSKHHYALTLLAQGHEVFFMNPPTYSNQHAFVCQEHSQHKGLQIVDYSLYKWFPQIRFRLSSVYPFLLKKYVFTYYKDFFSQKWDEVWCFESNIFFDLRIFKANVLLYLPVDNVSVKNQQLTATHADGIVSIAQVILDTINAPHKKQLLLNHGLGAAFATMANQLIVKSFIYKSSETINVAYVGNLLMRGVLDKKTFQQLILQNPAVQFHIFGPYLPTDNNLGSGGWLENKDFIDFLQNVPNVQLYGRKTQVELVSFYEKMDVFLVCYDVDSDMNKGSNSHKIMEYLSAGKVVVANHVSSYEDKADLLEMPVEMSNESLPAIFQKVVHNLEYYNRLEMQKKRITFALENTYAKQTERVLAFSHSLTHSVLNE